MRTIGTSIAALVILCAPAAWAQEKTFYLDRAQVSGAPDDGLMLWRPSLPDETRFYGSLALGYSQNPLRVAALTTDEDLLREAGNPVSNQLLAYLAAGTEVAGRVGLGVVLPVGLYMRGHDPAAEAGGDAPNAPLSPTALHDLGFTVRVPLVTGVDGRLRAGVAGALWLPTGDATSFAGDDQVTGMPSTSVEYDLGRLLLGGMVGVHLRPENGVTNSTLDVASELRWVLAGFVPLRDRRVRLGLELWGSTGVEPANGRDTVLERSNTDLEWLAQGRYALDAKRRAWLTGAAGTRLSAGYGAPDVRLLASVGYWFPVRDKEQPPPPPRFAAPAPEPESDRDGDGFPDAIDACDDLPEDRVEPDPQDGCPVGADRDGDTIPDASDRCPEVAEDRDQIADTDGCPEEDADHDTFPDATDKCPESVGLDHPDPERFGCPTEAFDLRGRSLVLLVPIQFEYNSAVIKPVSYSTLDDVVAFMRSREDQSLGVYGHTDDRGPDDYNLRLSKARAKSVLEYLVGRGIPRERLESDGFGETRPKTTNDTEAGRASNRRVEFILLD